MPLLPVDQDHSRRRAQTSGVLWSHRQGDPQAVAHRTEPGRGRLRRPLCGASTKDLWFRHDHDWLQVPVRQRCPECETREVGPEA